jgi:hypothetical protein
MGEKKRRKKERQVIKRDTKTIQQAAAREWAALAQSPQILAPVGAASPMVMGPMAPMGWGFMVPPM